MAATRWYTYENEIVDQHLHPGQLIHREGERVLQIQDRFGNWRDAGECPNHGRLPGAVVYPGKPCNGLSVNCPCNL